MACSTVLVTDRSILSVEKVPFVIHHIIMVPNVQVGELTEKQCSSCFFCMPGFLQEAKMTGSRFSFIPSCLQNLTRYESRYQECRTYHGIHLSYTYSTLLIATTALLCFALLGIWYPSQGTLDIISKTFYVTWFFQRMETNISQSQTFKAFWIWAIKPFFKSLV